MADWAVWDDNVRTYPANRRDNVRTNPVKSRPSKSYRPSYAGVGRDKFDELISNTTGNMTGVDRIHQFTSGSKHKRKKTKGKENRFVSQLYLNESSLVQSQESSAFELSSSDEDDYSRIKNRKHAKQKHKRDSNLRKLYSPSAIKKRKVLHSAYETKYLKNYKPNVNRNRDSKLLQHYKAFSTPLKIDKGKILNNVENSPFISPIKECGMSECDVKLRFGNSTIKESLRSFSVERNEVVRDCVNFRYNKTENESYLEPKSIHITPIKSLIGNDDSCHNFNPATGSTPVGLHVKSNVNSFCANVSVGGVTELSKSSETIYDDSHRMNNIGTDFVSKIVTPAGLKVKCDLSNFCADVPIMGAVESIKTSEIVCVDNSKMNNTGSDSVSKLVEPVGLKVKSDLNSVCADVPGVFEFSKISDAANVDNNETNGTGFCSISEITSVGLKDKYDVNSVCTNVSVGGIHEINNSLVAVRNADSEMNNMVTDLHSDLKTLYEAKDESTCDVKNSSKLQTVRHDTINCILQEMVVGVNNLSLKVNSEEPYASNICERLSVNIKENCDRKKLMECESECLKKSIEHVNKFEQEQSDNPEFVRLDYKDRSDLNVPSEQNSEDDILGFSGHHVKETEDKLKWLMGICINNSDSSNSFDCDESKEFKPIINTEGLTSPDKQSHYLMHLSLKPDCSYNADVHNSFAVPVHLSKLHHSDESDSTGTINLFSAEYNASMAEKSSGNISLVVSDLTDNSIKSEYVTDDISSYSQNGNVVFDSSHQNVSRILDYSVDEVRYNSFEDDLVKESMLPYNSTISEFKCSKSLIEDVVLQNSTGSSDYIESTVKFNHRSACDEIEEIISNSLHNEKSNVISDNNNHNGVINASLNHDAALIDKTYSALPHDDCVTLNLETTLDRSTRYIMSNNFIDVLDSNNYCDKEETLNFDSSQKLRKLHSVMSPFKNDSFDRIGILSSQKQETEPDILTTRNCETVSGVSLLRNEPELKWSEKFQKSSLLTDGHRRLNVASRQPLFETLAEESNEQDDFITSSNIDLRKNVTHRRKQLHQVLPTLNEDDTEEMTLSPIRNQSYLEESHLSSSAIMKRSLYLDPGKKWRRSFLTMKMSRDPNFSLYLNDKNKGRNWRKTAEYWINHTEMMHETKNFDETCDPKIYSCGDDRTVHPYFEDKNEYSRVRFSLSVLPADDESSNESFNISDSSILQHSANNAFGDFGRLPAKELILKICEQTEPIPFDACFEDCQLPLNCKKIGEGVYGEVFMLKRRKNRASVLKIIPIEGEMLVNQEKQKKYEEIMSELVITCQLSNLRMRSDYHTSCFAEVTKCWCVYGKYPEFLIDLWNKYDELKGSDNDSPSMFLDYQHYIILEMAHGGEDAESFEFNNAQQALSIFNQTVCALAVAEEAFMFEHRDLHWGNILISKCRKKATTFKIRDEERVIPLYGVKVTIIDFTLSRISLNNRCTIFNNIGLDPELFTAEGDFQFEVYRLMRTEVNNNWVQFVPKTNVYWLYYLLDKMLKEMKYRRKTTKIHKLHIEKLEQLYRTILNNRSCYEIIQSYQL